MVKPWCPDRLLWRSTWRNAEPTVCGGTSGTTNGPPVRHRNAGGAPPNGITVGVAVAVGALSKRLKVPAEDASLDGEVAGTPLTVVAGNRSAIVLRRVSLRAGAGRCCTGAAPTDLAGAATGSPGP